MSELILAIIIAVFTLSYIVIVKDIYKIRSIQRASMYDGTRVTLPEGETNYPAFIEHDYNPEKHFLFTKEDGSKVLIALSNDMSIQKGASCCS